MASDVWTDAATRAFSIVGVIVGFRYFARKYPVSSSDVAAFDQEIPISGLWTALAVVLWVVSTVLMTIGLASWWRLLNSALAGLHGPSLLTLHPTGGWWYLYSGFASLSLSWYAVKPLLRLLMSPGRFAVWDYQQSRQAGFDSNRAFKWVGAAIMVPFTICFLPSLGCHSRFTDSGVAVQGYGQLAEKHHAYNSVETAAIVRGYRDRSGMLHNDPHVTLRFRDGSIWSSRDGFRDPEPLRQDLIALLQSKVGRLRTVPTDHEL